MKKKEIEFTEISEESSSRTVHSKKNDHHLGKSALKGGNEKKYYGWDVENHPGIMFINQSMKIISWNIYGLNGIHN